MILCGIIAPVLALSVFALAALRVPGYDHVADTISKLSAQGVGDRWLWTIGLLVYSILMGLFSVGLRRRFGSIGGARTLWVAMAAHAGLMAGVAVFRDDLRPGGFFTLEGAAHDVLAGMAFSALVVAMLGARSLAKSQRTLESIRLLTGVLGIGMTFIAITFVFISPTVQGVPQRAFVVLAATWVIGLALRSASHPGGG